MPTFYEFFAGIGMASTGLGRGWTCIFANDFSPLKERYYRANHPNNPFLFDDVRNVTVDQLPDEADLAWSSFPCADLSIAGQQKGLIDGEQSSMLFPFWSLMMQLRKQGRAPRIICFENVSGLVRLKNNEYFLRLCQLLAEGGYRFGAVMMDNNMFLPCNRFRVFVVAVRDDLPIPNSIVSDYPSPTWHPDFLVRAVAKMAPEIRARWIYWYMPTPSAPVRPLNDYLIPLSQLRAECWRDSIGKNSVDVLIEPISWKRSREAAIATIYSNPDIQWAALSERRERWSNGTITPKAIHVWENNIAPCIMKSHPLLVVSSHLRTKLVYRIMTSIEIVRLMGLPETTVLPVNYKSAYLCVGAGLSIPCVDWLARHVLDELTRSWGHGP